MQLKRKNYRLLLILSVGMILPGVKAFSQTAPPQPPPPPNPVEVFNKINPFKKKNKDKTEKKDTAKLAPVPPAGGPPPPPNPLKLFKKKKRDTVRTAVPSQKSSK